MQNKKRPLEVKIITLGDSHVGKSSLIFKFIEDTFSSSYMSTVGFDLKFKTIKINNEEIKVMIFDTAGQERFRSLASNYIRKANGILLVYDISDKNTFLNIENWMTNIKEESSDTIPIILIGNKCDLDEQRKIQKEEGEQFANNNNLKFFETSCKDGDNVENCFIELTKQIIERKKEKQFNPNTQKLVNIKDKKKEKDCC